MERSTHVTDKSLGNPVSASGSKRGSVHPLAARNRQQAPVKESSGRSLSIDRRLMSALLQRLGPLPIEMVLWDGTVLPGGESPHCRLRIRNRSTLWNFARNPALWFGEGYADGSLEIEGDFFEFLRVAVRTAASLNGATKRKSGFLARLRARSLAFARKNIYHHYDIGNEFYKLWLDDRMLYTCAYYRLPEMSLEEAQLAKMDHICRKLQLRPGETVIEAGCGWGGFALHMARNYGVRVRAYNISHEQILHARELARSEHLEQRVEFIEDDWRNVSGRCDAFVSVGMLEHVGIDNFEQLGRVIDASLHAHGRGLIHSIGRNFPAPLNPWIRRHIFPGAEPPALSQAMSIFEERNLSVLDIENIRLHYALTCRHWLERFEERADEIRAQFDERFVRTWRLYLASSSLAFECGALQLFQILFAPGRSNAVPWTRDYMYRDDDRAERGSVWKQIAGEAAP